MRFFVTVITMPSNTIQARVNVAVSRQFFGWITGLGNIVKIEAPERVVEQYRDYLGEIIERYS